eukprot:TRINITY_DN3681_c0_g1_i1.p1 TRINITY_DN3681_c0_g1~~TRINITY_DN3681_c0_g1_i1.p1  ORF type:complete len:143 (-),score=32.06 TRINITY_DN3681_c0_g1_i1:117-545(-)
MEVLDLKDNSITDILVFEKPLSCMQRLRVLDLRGNAIIHMPKFRDYLVMWSPSLRELNGRNILQNERQFLINFHRQKSSGVDERPKKEKHPDDSASLHLSGKQAPSLVANIRDQGEGRIAAGLNKPNSFYTSSVHNVTKKTS